MNRTLLAIALAAAFASAAQANPFASEVVASSGLTGTGLYNDPAAVLGKPTTRFNDGTAANPDFHRAKPIEASYNTGLNGEKLLTTFNLNQSVTVRFDTPILNNPNNPFGLDFIVFGNTFFSPQGGGFINDDTNLNLVTIGGGSFDEPLKISVSPDNLQWYTYDDGPFGDTLFPTNAYLWDRANARWTDTESDFTKPMDPAITRASLAGRSVADVLDLYNGSAGGTAFDLAPSGFSSIQYIRVTGVTGFRGGEIDGFSAVRPNAPVPEPASLAALGLGALALLRRRRRSA